MAKLQRFIPQSPDPYLKQGDQLGAVKFGHLNALVDAINSTIYGDYLQLAGSGPMSTTLRALEDPDGNLAQLFLAIDKTAISGPLKVGDSSANNASAILEISSTTKGVLFPKMTVAQRDAIVSPAIGLMIYNTDEFIINSWDGTEWTTVGGGGVYEEGVGLLSTQRSDVGNTALGNYSAALAGQNNCATGIYSTILGGVGNKALGCLSTVGGGINNCVCLAGTLTFIGGGCGNTVSGSISTIGGGRLNTASNSYASILGGQCNTASGAYSTALGKSANASGAGSLAFSGTASGGYSISLGGNATGYNSVAIKGSATSTGSIAIGVASSAGFAALAMMEGAFAPSESIAIGNYARATGGQHSVAIGNYNCSASFASTVSGGICNKALNSYSVVAGGFSNCASGTESFVGGGNNNLATASDSIVVGGQQNSATATYSTVVGGCANIASGYGSFIGGGINNCSINPTSFIGSGFCNRITSSAAQGMVIGGGICNQLTQNDQNQHPMVIGGGQCNCIGGAGGVIGGGTLNIGGGYNINHTTISGGCNNTASTYGAVISGGICNSATGCLSSILGGCFNTASEFGSIAGGFRSLASACNSTALGRGGCAIFPGQFAHSTVEYVGNVAYDKGLMQFSDLLVYNIANDATSNFTTGQEVLLYPGNNNTILFKPGLNKVWHVTAKYTMYVALVVGTVDGIVAGDSLFGTAEFGYRSGTGGFVTSTFRDSKISNNPLLNTGTFAFTYGASQQIVSKMIVPEFTGGGSLRIRANIKFELVETIQGS